MLQAHFNGVRTTTIIYKRSGSVKGFLLLPGGMVKLGSLAAARDSLNPIPPPPPLTAAEAQNGKFSYIAYVHHNQKVYKPAQASLHLPIKGPVKPPHSKITLHARNADIGTQFEHCICCRN